MPLSAQVTLGVVFGGTGLLMFFGGLFAYIHASTREEEGRLNRSFVRFLGMLPFIVLAATVIFVVITSSK